MPTTSRPQLAVVTAGRAQKIEAELARNDHWTPTECWHAWKTERRMTPWGLVENGFRLLGEDRTSLDLSWWQFEIVMRNYSHMLVWTKSPYANAHRTYLEGAIHEVDARVARGEIAPPQGSRTSWSEDPASGTVMAPNANPEFDWSQPLLPVASQLGGNLGWQFARGVHPHAEGLVVATS